MKMTEQTIKDLQNVWNIIDQRIFELVSGNVCDTGSLNETQNNSIEEVSALSLLRHHVGLLAFEKGLHDADESRTEDSHQAA